MSVEDLKAKAQQIPYNAPTHDMVTANLAVYHQSVGEQPVGTPMLQFEQRCEGQGQQPYFRRLTIKPDVWQLLDTNWLRGMAGLIVLEHRPPKRPMIAGEVTIVEDPPVLWITFDQPAADAKMIVRQKSFTIFEALTAEEVSLRSSRGEIIVNLYLMPR